MSTKTSHVAVLLGFGGLAWPYTCVAMESLPLQLPKSADEQATLLDYNAYFWAEKLDGVRGYWDGKQLLSRRGHVIEAPDWFIAPLPTVPVEGELWIDRGRFADVSGIVRQTRSHAGWEQVRFMVFDLPNHAGHFEQRHQALADWVATVQASHIQLIPTAAAVSQAQVEQELAQIKAKGGEGIMLYRRDSYYARGRTNNVLKLKGYDDAEAQVIGYTQGKGKYKGVVGALIVRYQDTIVHLGSGLSDQDRHHPPEIGCWVTFRYNGLTKTGVPRFARFHRVRGLTE